jgi:hypothetical protein
MNEQVAALVQPYIPDDAKWVMFSAAVSKDLRQTLNADPKWEDRFEIKCADVRSPFAHFRFYRHVVCKHLVYDLSHIWGEYAVSIFVKTGQPFACQAFPQLFLAERRLDEYFPEVVETFWRGA